MRQLGWKFLALAWIYMVAVGGYVYYLYDETKAIIDDNINNKLLYAARATASILGETYHDGLIDKNSKTEAEDWRTIERLTKFNNELGLTFVYTVIKRDGQVILTSSSASDEELEANSEVRFFDPYPDASEELHRSFEGSEPIWTDYTDHWGDFRAVFVPYRSSDGTVYVAGAEVSLEEFHTMLHWDSLRHIGLAILIFASLSLVVALYLLRLRTHLLQHQANERALTKAKETAEIADRAKSAFLATMSHEIRTPMNGVIGTTELLLSSELTSEQRSYLRTIQTSGQTLLSLIDDILDLSKIEAGKLELHSRTFALAPLVYSTMELIQQNLGGKPIRLGCHVGDEVPIQVHADADRLRQVLINLLGNAVKFTETGEVSLTVTASQTEAGTLLRFCVADTGIGIPSEEFAKLFKPFTQLDASSTRRYGGTGLGLSICKNLVEAMGGTIEVASQVGVGSRFYFTIACAPACEQEVTTPEFPDTVVHDDRMAQSNPLSVLVVEDNPVNGKIALAMLDRLGYQAMLAKDGLEALAACKQRAFDLIFMDMNMPRMDGLEATRKIRSEHQGRQPYIVAFTANAFRSEIKKCEAAGMDDYLIKPVKLQALTKMLEKASELRRRELVQPHRRELNNAD